MLRMGRTDEYEVDFRVSQDLRVVDCRVRGAELPGGLVGSFSIDVGNRTEHVVR